MDDLNTVIADNLRLNVAEINDDLTMAQVNHWDSLTHMQLIVALEQYCGQQFSMDDIVNMTTVGNIKTIVAQYARA